MNNFQVRIKSELKNCWVTISNESTLGEALQKVAHLRLNMPKTTYIIVKTIDGLFPHIIRGNI